MRTFNLKGKREREGEQTERNGYPLNFFQAQEDCDQFRIVNGTSPLLRYHKGHRSNNKDSCSKSMKDQQDLLSKETWYFQIG